MKVNAMISSNLHTISNPNGLLKAFTIPGTRLAESDLVNKKFTAGRANVSTQEKNLH